MPDNIERTIYKLDLDDSDYIRGVERTVSSTQRLAIAQEEANRRLQTNQEALKANTTNLSNARRELENYTGTNQKVKQQLEKNIVDLEKQQNAITTSVNSSKEAYDKATQAAKNFAAASSQASATPVPIPATGPVSGGILPSGSAGATLQAFISQVNNSDFSDLNDALSFAENNFERFREATAAATEELELLEHTQGASAEEIRVMSESLNEAKAIIEEYDNLTKDAGASTLSYSTQIKQLNNQLRILTETGKENTKEYIETRRELVRLTEAQRNQREVIKILSSETRALDFGKAAITAATTAFQGYTAVSILAGGASEDLQKKTFQLFAIMQLLTSLEQLHNLTKKESVIVTNAQSAAQAVYTAVIGTTTGAVKSLRTALLASGVGVAIVGLGILIAKIIEEKEELEKVSEAQKLMNDLHEKAASTASEAVAKLFLYKRTLNDLTIPEKERVRVLKEYNKEADESNKINETQINNLQLINEKLSDQNKLLLENAISIAANAKLTEEAQKLIQVRLPVEELAKTAGLPLDTFIVEFTNLNNQRNEQIKKFSDAYKANNAAAQKAAIDQEKVIINSIGELLKTGDKSINALSSQIPKILQAIFNFEQGKEKFEDIGALLSGLIKTIKTKPGGGTGEIENVFEQEKQRLLDRLRQISIDEEEGIKKINDEFAFKFEQEQRRVAGLLKAKKINAGQATELLGLSARINKQELDKALKEFHDRVVAENKKLNDELDDLNKKNREDQLNLIQDEFDRRRQLIEFNEQNELAAVKKATDEKLAVLDKNKDELIKEGSYYTTRAKIVEEGEQRITNITLDAAQQRSKLSEDIFLKSLEAFDNAISDSKLINDKAALEEIKKLVDSFSIGKTTYEDYRKQLSAIQDKYDRLQLLKQVDTLQEELRVLKRELNNELDTTSKHYDDLIKLIRQKELELVAAQKNLATSGVNDTGTDPEKDARIQKIKDYAVAVGQLIEGVIQFWKKSNEVEAAALDRSIALQERRVTEAQRIAERGNASYLKMEEDRLKQLQIARENAARRQLAIDAALQASQLLVGVTGAIADLGKSALGPAQVIADIAVIVGALASGYALVKSLQANQLRLATGTEYVKRKDEPAGVDTIPAWLTEGEAVIPQEKNRKYKKSVQAIYHGKVPADVLNEFVQNYVTNKSDKKTSTETNVVNKTAISNIENKTDTSNAAIYKNFIHNITKVPAKVLNNFIENYSKSDNKFYKGTPYLVGTKGVDKINIWASEGEAIIPKDKNILYNPVIEAIHGGTVPATYLNKIIERYQNNTIDRNNISKHSEKYHTLKTVPQVNYQKIKDTAALHISTDGKLALVMSEQNRKIDENNDLQRQTLRAMKNMAVSASIDRNGVAIAVNEYIEKMKIDKRV